MREKKQYKSEAFASIHETMDSFHQIEAINKKTMSNFDRDCLETISEVNPKNIKAYGLGALT